MRQILKRLRREIGPEGTLWTEHYSDVTRPVRVRWAVGKETIKREITRQQVKDPGAVAGLGAGMKKEYREHKGD